MDSATNTKQDAPFTAKSSTTGSTPPVSPKDADCAIEKVREIVKRIEEGTQGDEVQLLASGGFNDIWLVHDHHIQDDVDRFVLRKPKEDTLLPDQLRNEVACLKFVRENMPNIPVPRVYDYHFNGTSAEGVYIAEEFIEGRQLSDAWSTYDESTKMNLAQQIAKIVISLGGITFNGIGGLMIDGTLGPTVEGIKLFKGRNRFHFPTCYDIGPYTSTKRYVLACYDKEIYYYTHAPSDDIDWDLFPTNAHKEQWIQQLTTEREVISQDSSVFPPEEEEPFVLVHGDLHGWNIMVDTDAIITGILDWEFAGAYPLSELLGGMGVDVLEVVDEAGEEENCRWSAKIVELAGEIARERGWEERRVELLVGAGSPELQKVRVEMFP